MGEQLSEANRALIERALETTMAAALRKWPSDVEPDDTPVTVAITMAQAKRVREMIVAVKTSRQSEQWKRQLDRLPAARTEGSHRGESGEPVADNVRAYIAKHKPRCYSTTGGFARRTAFAEIEAILAASPPPKEAGPDPVAKDGELVEAIARRLAAVRGHKDTDHQIALNQGGWGPVWTFYAVEADAIITLVVTLALPVEGVTDDQMRALLAEAREYVVDALEGYEHSDGRELVNGIDAALTARKPGGV